MKRSRLLVLGLLASVLLDLHVARAAEPIYKEATHGRGSLEYVQGIPVLELAGTPEEIGSQHASLAMAAIRPQLGLARKILEAHGLGAAWPVVGGISRVMVSNAPQRYRTELEAAIQAAELDRDAATGVYVANAMIELRRMGGCSAFAVEPERSAAGELLFGRNLDFPVIGDLDRLSVLMIVRPEGKYAFASVGFPSLIGVLSGMNEKGLAVATLDVYSSKDGSPIFNPQGAPLGLTYRQILEECATVDEAEKLLQSARHTTWMNLAVCDRDQAVVFEITPASVVRRSSEAHLLACTNHFRTDQLCTSTACRRYDALRAYWKREKIGLQDVAQALHTVHQGPMTMQTMIFEPKSLKLHLAIGKGPTSNQPLKLFALEEHLKPRAK